ncbi:GTP-dependent nucleic acid-binding protein engD [Enterobacter hormaechei]|nr:GTP-dependent nucleic acid-binding protein engD [Enterobacter hormaechei]
MEPEDFRGINPVDTRQRIVAVLIAVDVGQRHIPVHFLQQPEPFPDKPRGDWLTGWLAAQHLAARFADAATERIVAEADLRLRLVAVPRLADHLRQAMLADVAVVPAGLSVIFLHGASVDVIAPANAVQLRQPVVRNLLSRSFERVTGSIPAVQPRALKITGNYIPAMQAAKTVIFAAGSLVLVVCATVESDNTELDDADREEFMEELGQEGPGAKEGGKMRA